MAWTGLELARGAQEIYAVRLAERGVFRNRSQHFRNKNCSFFLVAFIFPPFSTLRVHARGMELMLSSLLCSLPLSHLLLGKARIVKIDRPGLFTETLGLLN